MRPIPAPIRRRIPDLVVLALLGAHLLLAGCWWLWNLVSIVPPWMFFLPPIGLLLWNLHRRDRLGVLLVPLAFALAWPNLDVQLPGRPVPATPGAAVVRVFNWNTQYWEEDPARARELYAFLRRQDADVYHLQEHLRRDHRMFDDLEEIARAFPGYATFSKGELLTLTRLPVLAQDDGGAGEFLRTEVEAGGRRIVLLNVHVPVHVIPELPAATILGLRRRFEWRAREFALLDAEIDGADAPLYVSGDFNTTTAMGSMRGVLPGLRDSYTAAPVVFPRTWMDGLRWWRIDWNLLGRGLHLLSHEDVDPEGFSDHWGQRVTFEVTKN